MSVSSQTPCGVSRVTGWESYQLSKRQRPEPFASKQQQCHVEPKARGVPTFSKQGQIFAGTVSLQVILFTVESEEQIIVFMHIYKFRLKSVKKKKKDLHLFGKSEQTHGFMLNISPI